MAEKFFWDRGVMNFGWVRKNTDQAVLAWLDAQQLLRKVYEDLMVGFVSMPLLVCRVVNSFR